MSVQPLALILFERWLFIWLANHGMAPVDRAADEGLGIGDIIQQVRETDRGWLPLHVRDQQPLLSRTCFGEPQKIGGFGSSSVSHRTLQTRIPHPVYTTSAPERIIRFSGRGR